MKQITPEIKARVFALYYNQQAVVTKGNYTHKQGTHCLIDGDVLTSIGLGTLVKYKYAVLVKQLSSITDEDAVEVANIATGWNEDEYLNPSDVPYWLDEILTGNCALTANYVSGYQIIDVIDCLRSKGYALPAFGYSVDELVAEGVFKLRGEQK